MKTPQPWSLIRNTFRRAARKRPLRRLRFEPFEPRWAPAASCGPNCLEIELIPEFDLFGPQIETVMGYKEANQPDEQARVSFALYDTGASVVTFSAADQLLHELLGNPIPIKVPGGAAADAIGGPLVGDVSQPGEIIADGLHAVTLGDDILDLAIDFSEATRTEGVQAFIGTTDGSPILPTITGTVVHQPSPTHPNGAAALIDMTAYQLDFGALFPEIPEFKDIVVDLPDLRFVDPGMNLTAPDETITDPVRIPLELWGESNHADPGDSITTTPNPVQTGVRLRHGGAESIEQTLLFDTGAQLSVISTAIAAELGLDLNNPYTSLTVQGAAGQVTVPGFIIDVLEFPRDDNGDGIEEGVLRMTNVPLFVLDVVPGLGGLIGMNLFNLAKGMLYDPFDPAGPSLQLTFFKELVRELPDEEEEAAIEMLTEQLPVTAGWFGGQGLPSFGLDVPDSVNLPPSAGDGVLTTNEDTVGVGDLRNFATDPDDGDTLSFSPAAITTAAGAVVTIDPNGAFSYDPRSVPAFQALAVGEQAADSFEYTATDAAGESDTGIVHVTITGVNDIPEAGDDETSTDEDTSVIIDVLDNDTDPDDDPLSIISTTDALHGSIAVNADNTIRYTPAENFHGTDSFTYIIGDGRGGEATATVSLTVDPANDAPTAIELANTAVNENSPGAEIGAVTVTDPDAGDTHTLEVSDSRFEIVGGVLKLQDDVALDFETEAIVVVQITATDSGSPPQGLTQEFVLDVLDLPEGEHPWQNPDLRWDVDADGLVGLFDLLAIVGALRDREGPYELPQAPGEAEDGPPPYLDVDGDNWVTLNDLVETLTEIRNTPDPVYFVVAEWRGQALHNDSYVLPLRNSADIAHARALIAQGPEVAGAPIVTARIAPGADGINRNVLAPGQPAWSWHVTRFDGFADATIELCDGWPTFVEDDVDGWIANTGGTVCFWTYTVVAELP